MIRNWKTYFFSILAACNLVALPTTPSAATTVIASGNAFLTSNINKDIFRARAIENESHLSSTGLVKILLLGYRDRKNLEDLKRP